MLNDIALVIGFIILFIAGVVYLHRTYKFIKVVYTKTELDLLGKRIATIFIVGAIIYCVAQIFSLTFILGNDLLLTETIL
jgi:uncharacterized membrane protein